MLRIGLLLGFALLSLAGSGRAGDTLDDNERAELRRYLAELKQGRPGSAAQVDRLAGLSFAGLREVMEAYVALPASAEPHTHRSFHVLLERTSREALAPWSLLSLYSPELAAFVTATPEQEPLIDKLFTRLMRPDAGRLADDLAVRLTPLATLRELSKDNWAIRVELLEAWNRRLARGRESRPIPEREKLFGKVSRDPQQARSVADAEAHLRFLALTGNTAGYRSVLRERLGSDNPALVLAGLAVQRQVPALLELNEKLIEKFVRDPKIVEQAVRNYAFDDKQDHSATLRQLWDKLPADQAKARYSCLFAMGAHPLLNDELALAAVKEQGADFIDVALPILTHGKPALAQQAVRYLLDGKQGHEEALRLARELKLPGFEGDALRIALDAQREQIVRQTALQYLQRADGKVRRQVLPFLTHPQADLRLSAIQTFAEPVGLTDADRGEIGPALIRVALTDASQGHRQEAIYALGCWRAKLAGDFFRKVLTDHPPVVLTRGQYNNDAHYWQYRLRLMGLLGLVKLGDAEARKELLALHAQGGPAERMDVLLAFHDLGTVPDFAFKDLAAGEPKLVATAARLIATHGSAADKDLMRTLFQQAPLWRAFQESGIDDHNILRLVGVSGDE